MANAQQTRTRLLDAAERHFFQAGIAVTGVDSVAASAGVSVVTLYNHFGSKENLLREVLERRFHSWQEHWDAAIARAEGPTESLLAVFDAVDTFRAAAGPTQWCCFLATASERPVAAEGGEDPVAGLLRQDTALITGRLLELARRAGCPDPRSVADFLLLLYNGVLSSLLRGEPEEPTARARTIARTLLAGPAVG